MQELRFALGLILIFVMPMVITFWLVIHMGANLWRKNRLFLPYLCAGICISAVLFLLIGVRETLIGRDLGNSWLLFGMGLFIYLLSFSLWRPIKRHLNFRTFAGVPEVSSQPIPLIKEGPFALVRHPRYLMVIVSVIGWCLMSNYLGVYLMGVCSIMSLVIIVQLEERDLVVRFGEEYRNYRQQVPQLIPSRTSLKNYLTRRSARKEK